MTGGTDPKQTAGLYPLHGALLLLRHPPPKFKQALTHPLSASQSLLPDLLKYLIFTILLVYIGYWGVDYTLLTTGLAAKDPKNQTVPGWFRRLLVFLGVLFAVGWIGSVIVGEKVKGMAKGVGKGVLMEKVNSLGGGFGGDVGKVVEGVGKLGKLGKLGDDEGESKEEKAGKEEMVGSKKGGGGLGGVLTNGGSSITNGVGKVTSTAASAPEKVINDSTSIPSDVAKTVKETASSMSSKVSSTWKNHTTSWLVNRCLVAPAAALVPIAGPIFLVALSSVSTAKSYIAPYAEMLGPAVSDALLGGEESTGALKSFGFVAGLLTTLPVVGPVFHFSNYVGAALLVADMQEYRLKKMKKLI